MLLQGGAGGCFPPKIEFKSYFFVLVPSHGEGRDKIIYDTFLDVGKETEDTFIKVYVPHDYGFEECRTYFGIKKVPAFIVTTNCKIKNDEIQLPNNDDPDILYFTDMFFLQKLAQSPQELRDLIYDIHLACRDVKRGIREAKKGVLIDSVKVYLQYIWKDIKDCVQVGAQFR